MKQEKEIVNHLYVTDREAWREWLNENYETAVEIWLIYPRKHTGNGRIPYNDAVEEALCFGWIDSITKTIDDDRYSQRFTPRNPKSSYSQTNKERLRRLVSQEKVIPEILKKVERILDDMYQFPDDIMAALKEDTQVWANFNSYSGAYQRIRVAYVDSARKRPEAFAKRLNHLLRMTKQNKQFGFGIESYY